MRSSVGVLTASNGLGSYVPAVTFQRALRRLGIDATLVVLESLFSAAGQDKLRRLKTLFQRDWTFAVGALRLTSGVQAEIDAEQVKALFARWHQQGLHRFVVFSGHWLPTLEAFAASGGVVSIHCVLLDVQPAPSWTHLSTTTLHHHTVCVFDPETGRPRFRWSLPYPCVPWHDRAPRVVIHGGGWEIGDFTATLNLVRRSPFVIDFITGNAQLKPGQGERRLQLPSDWWPWQSQPESEAPFPPLEEVLPDQFRTIPTTAQCPALQTLIAHSQGIVSKPGGATLLDSVTTATPILFTTPYGEHERANQVAWLTSKFGITLEDWAQNDFALAPLREMHAQLADLWGTVPEYANVYAAENFDPV